MSLVIASPYGLNLHIDSAIFSPDSQHFAYWAKRRGEWCVVLDGKAGKACAEPGFRLLFSPDSRHLATLARRTDGSTVLVVDGVEGPVYDRIFRLAFDGSNRIRLLAERSGTKPTKEWMRVELDLVEHSERPTAN